jgi:cell division protein FtsA
MSMLSRSTPAVRAAIDIGTSKVCCFIARPEESGGMRAVGFGHILARGIEAGSIVDMEEAEASVARAVQAAEQMAGERIDEVAVNVSAGRPASQSLTVEVTIGGHEVGERDVRRILANSRVATESPDRAVLHSLPVGYSVDGAGGIRDPRGMIADRLGVNVHVVTAAAGPLRNLDGCVARCHLDVAAHAVSPLASALAVLVDDEMELGVTVIDMGAGTTSAAVFVDGACVHTEVVPIGGLHVSNDIARVLSTPAAHADRMKILFGSAVTSRDDDREVIDVPALGESQPGGVNHVPRSLLVSIIRPRIEETLEILRGRLEAAGVHKASGRRLVLTGGACQLQGARELAGQLFGKQVRIGKPMWLKGLGEANGGPAFATCAGLLRHVSHSREDAVLAPWVAQAGLMERVGRIGQWLRENF